MAETKTDVKIPVTKSEPEELDAATIRFAGDSGDGIQLTGLQFTTTTAFAGNDLSTFPDFPAEIRAPAGTLAGVSGFQIQFSSDDIFTPGDRLNEAALALRMGTSRGPIREAIRLLHEAGINAHGLSRGYGGSLREPTQVDAAIHTAADVGDEPEIDAAPMPSPSPTRCCCGTQRSAQAGAWTASVA